MGEILDRQQAATRHRLDVEAYYKMAEVGILSQDERVELIDGEIFDMVPIGVGHAGKTNRFNRLFAHAAADGLALVSVQTPLRLDSFNEPQPDVMLLRPRADDYQKSPPKRGRRPPSRRSLRNLARLRPPDQTSALCKVRCAGSLDR